MLKLLRKWISRRRQPVQFVPRERVVDPYAQRVLHETMLSRSSIQCIRQEDGSLLVKNLDSGEEKAIPADKIWPPP